MTPRASTATAPARSRAWRSESRGSRDRQSLRSPEERPRRKDSLDSRRQEEQGLGAAPGRLSPQPGLRLLPRGPARLRSPPTRSRPLGTGQPTTSLPHLRRY
eukprot:12031954-Alexandrium_andersonii.AAC.1